MSSSSTTDPRPSPASSLSSAAARPVSPPRPEPPGAATGWSCTSVTANPVGACGCCAGAGAQPSCSDRSITWSASWSASRSRSRPTPSVDADLLRASRADVVVLATGARPPEQPLPRGDGSVPIITIDDALAGGYDGARVVVVDHRGMEEGALTAEALALTGSPVTIATPMATAGANIGFTRIREHLLRLAGAGVELLVEHPSDRHRARSRDHPSRPHPSPGRARGGRDRGQRRRSSPSCRCAQTAEDAGAVVLLAGDSMAPRTAMHAFREGDAAGRAA